MGHTEYVDGQRLVVEGEFLLEGVPTDPTVVRCYVRDPSGATSELVYPSADLQRVDTGLYEAAVTADAPGTWAFRFVGLGDVEAVREVVTNVAASRVI